MNTRNLDNPIPGAFLQRLAAEQTRVTFIGMSGLGKSFWSKMLEQKGFKRFCCDNIIADRILRTCDSPRGKIGCLGQWMGFPSDPDYEARAQQYLSAEKEVLLELLAYAAACPPGEKIVIDTTGSAPYAGEAVMQQLKELTCVVHLATAPKYTSKMLQHYIRSPRPVIWGAHYRKHAADSDAQTLARCYPQLLAYREALYIKYADYSIPYELHRI